MKQRPRKENIDTVAIRASAQRILVIASEIGVVRRSLRHDLVVEAAAIIRLCGPK